MREKCAQRTARSTTPTTPPTPTLSQADVGTIHTELLGYVMDNAGILNATNAGIGYITLTPDGRPAVPYTRYAFTYQQAVDLFLTHPDYRNKKYLGLESVNSDATPKVDGHPKNDYKNPIYHWHVRVYDHKGKQWVNENGRRRVKRENGHGAVSLMCSPPYGETNLGPSKYYPFNTLPPGTIRGGEVVGSQTVPANRVAFVLIIKDYYHQYDRHPDGCIPCYMNLNYKNGILDNKIAFSGSGGRFVDECP